MWLRSILVTRVSIWANLFFMWAYLSFVVLIEYADNTDPQDAKQDAKNRYFRLLSKSLQAHYAIENIHYLTYSVVQKLSLHKAYNRQ
jgi:hypothetical protein